MPSGFDAFVAGGRFFRGNLHTHSRRSDGALPAEAVCRFYREAGYDFLCMSDHFLARYGFPITDTRPYRTNAFTTILGAEVHAGENSQGEMWHVLAVGLPADFAPPTAHETGEELAARAKAAGAFVGIAHPEWSSLTPADGRAMAPHAHAVELWNSSSAIETGRGGGPWFLDALVSEGHRHLTGYATDDAHFKTADHGVGWMMVKAGMNEPEALVAAMKAGAYYSSTGPTLELVARDGDEVVVECSPVPAIAIVGRGCRAKTVAAPIGGTVTAARLPLAPFAGDWCRVVALGPGGATAWTNPIFP